MTTHYGAGGTFPDRATRYERAYELMRFWTAAAARHRCARMTDNAEAAAVWIPPGKSEMTELQESRLATRMGELLGERAHELNALFDQLASTTRMGRRTTT
jgi:hypothetical protein